MLRPLIILLLLGSTLLAADPPPAPRAFDLLNSAYGPYVDPNDPLGMPAKVRALSVNPYAFWRGAKDLFFLWCKNNTQKWLADKDAYVRQEGDQHLGNVGTYMTGRNFGSMAFGMVDFDDSHSLPFQFELLQGIITLRLAAAENQISIADDQLDQLISTILENYENAANSARDATDLLADDPTIVHMKTRLAKKKLRQRNQRIHRGQPQDSPVGPAAQAQGCFPTSDG